MNFQYGTRVPNLLREEHQTLVPDSTEGEIPSKNHSQFLRHPFPRDHAFRWIPPCTSSVHTDEELPSVPESGTATFCRARGGEQGLAARRSEIHRSLSFGADPGHHPAAKATIGLACERINITHPPSILPPRTCPKTAHMIAAFMSDSTGRGAILDLGKSSECLGRGVGRD